MNKQTLGPDLAKSLGDAHEDMLEDLLEKQMDLFNNEQGRNASSFFQEQVIVDLLNSGGLRIIENGALIPSHP